MQQMTPSKIFRKTEAVADMAVIMGVVIFMGIIGYLVYSIF